MSKFVLLRLQSYKNKISNISAYRILCLGDSFTYGVGAPLGKDYPSQLERILNEKCDKNKFETINRGIPGGYPSLELPDIMGRYIKKYNPHIVILMLRFHEYQWRYTDVSISNLSESINEKFWIMVIESENI